MNRIILILASVIFIRIGLASAYANDGRFTVIDIGDLGNEITWGYDINNNGEIVGTSYDGSVGANDRAFYWKAGTIGRIQGLESNSRANGINDRGQITGSIFSGYSVQPYVWESGVVTGLNVYGYGQAINNAGQAVGTALVGDWEAYIWKDGIRIDLGPSGAYAINEAGTIVAGEDGYATIWRNGVKTDILSSGGGHARAVNNKGQVVGLIEHRLDGGPTLRSPFLWQDGLLTYLADYGFAEGINENGQVVGYLGTEGNEYPFLWENGAMIDLRQYFNVDPSQTGRNFLGMDINNRGDILVYNDGRTFLLQSNVVPEPATLSLLGLGLLGLVFKRRKQ